MSDEWTLTGEAGKAVDATPRTLRAMQAEGLQVDYESLATDEMTWTLWLDDPADAEGILPEIGQTMTLRKGSARVFHGHCTRRAPRFSAGRRGYDVTISGPWYFLVNTSISSEIPDATTVQQERAVFLFDTGTPSSHLAALITRAAALGLPVSLGTIAETFLIPRLSLREMSFAEAISEVMRWVADGMIYVDYSGEGHPAICMQRRNAATTITIDPAVFAANEISIAPRYDLLVEELSVFWARRETIGNDRVTVYDGQTVGSTSSPLPTRQILTSTGPEIDTFLPQDLADSVVVRSEPFDPATALARDHDILRSANANVQIVESQFQDVLNTAGTGLSGGGSVTTINWPETALLRVTDRDGNPINLAQWPFVLSKGEVRNWWEKDGIEYIEGRVTGVIVESTVNGPADWHPEWAVLLGQQVRSHLFTNGGSIKQRKHVAATVSAPVVFVKTLWSADTTLIRSEDWGWFNPPEGLAANLLATQDWLPWQGLIPGATDDFPTSNAVGSLLNISNWLPETADMRGMIAGYTIRPATGQVWWRLGPPARHSYRDLVNRFRQSGADNIFWVSDQSTTAPWPTDPDLPAGALVFTGRALTYDTAPLTYN
ncbi:MAG: hypothetical protein ACNA8L_10265 [Luteolibacter sp.]